MNMRKLNLKLNPAVGRSFSLAAFLPAIALGMTHLNGYGLHSSEQMLSDGDSIAPIVSARGEESEQCQWLGVCE